MLSNHYEEPALSVDSGIDAVRRTGGLANFDWWVCGSAAAVAAANYLALTRFHLAFIGPALGLWFIIGYPVYLLSTTSCWRGISASERTCYSLASVLLFLMM